jgi:hypothetical protein
MANIEDISGLDAKARAKLAYRAAAKTSVGTKQQSKTKSTLNHQGQVENVFTQWDANGAIENMVTNRIFAFQKAGNLDMSKEEVIERTTEVEYDHCERKLREYLRACAEVVSFWATEADAANGVVAELVSERDAIINQMQAANQEGDEDLVAELTQKLLSLK